MKHSGISPALWTVALAVAALWPGRAVSIFDGIPLNGRVEAVVIAVVVPLLWVLDPSSLDSLLARAAIVVLLALKIGSTVGLTQQGICARFSTAAPLTGVISTIDINEPAGMLRSWDARADWRSANPSCTAVFDRS